MKGLIALGALAVLVFGSGCANATLKVVQQMSSTPETVALSIDAAEGVQMPQAAGDNFRGMLTTALSSKGIQVGTAGEGTPTVGGTITVYNPGSRGLRYLMPGVGAGHLSSTWRVVDSQGGSLGEAEVVGSINAGMFGGSFDDVLQHAANRVAEFLSNTGGGG